MRQDIDGLDLVDESKYGLEQIASEESLMVEAVIGPKASPLQSKSARREHFRARFFRSPSPSSPGKNLGSQLDEMFDFRRKLTYDFINGVSKDIERFRESEETILLDQAMVPMMKNFRNKLRSALKYSVQLVIASAAALKVAAISVASLAGVSLLFLTGCVKAKRGSMRLLNGIFLF